MVRRVLIAILVVAIGALGAAWFAEGTFTVKRSVRVDPPSILNEPTGMPRFFDGDEMSIECGPTSGHYVTDSGDRLFFNEVTGSPESAQPLCDDARSQRRVMAVGLALVGLLGGAAVLVIGRVRDRRMTELQVPPVDVAS
jgi:hypothetical protein